MRCPAAAHGVDVGPSGFEHDPIRSVPRDRHRHSTAIAHLCMRTPAPRCCPGTQQRRCRFRQPVERVAQEHRESRAAAADSSPGRETRRRSRARLRVVASGDQGSLRSRRRPPRPDERGTTRARLTRSSCQFMSRHERVSLVPARDLRVRALRRTQRAATAPPGAKSRAPAGGGVAGANRSKT